MIYTSYFAKLSKIPDNIVPVSIAGKAPDFYKGLEYKRLAPKYGFFIEWKKNHDNEFYIEHYNREVLKGLDVRQVLSELLNLTGSYDICLLCYEKTGDFCHRHLVAKWLIDNGVRCEELDIR